MNGEKTIKTLLIIAGLIIGLAVVNALQASASDFGGPFGSEFRVELPGRTEQVNPVSASTSLSILSLPKDRVKVAILDSGSDTAYKEGISLIDGAVRDYNGHGTLMARIIKEVNPDAELYIVKVMEKNGMAVNEETVILGLQWAISRDVDVINMSLRLKESARLHQAIKKAYDSGIVVVAAAGNRPASRQGRPASLQGGNEVACPAKYKEVIAVGALDRYGRVYDGSIEGEEVDVYCRGYKGRKAGTSIASAYCAGLAARIVSENPYIRTEEIKNIIGKTESLWLVPMGRRLRPIG